MDAYILWGGIGIGVIWLAWTLLVFITGRTMGYAEAVGEMRKRQSPPSQGGNEEKA